jgi:hypothetical protein
MDEASVIWAEKSIGSIDLQRIVPVKELGVDQIDYSNFISKTERWTTGRIGALRTLFPENTLRGKKVLVAKATGKLAVNDSVSVVITPLFLIDADTIRVNPEISVQNLD